MDLIAPIVKYNSQTVGRDKLCRTVQYTAKLLGYLLQQHGATADTVRLIKTLEVHVSTSRKLFRIGKYMDMLQGAFRNLSVKDTVLRVLVVSARLTRVLYFLVDQIVWATRLGLYKADPKAWSRFQAKIWSAALIFCVTRNLYDIYNLVKATDKKNEDPGVQTSLYEKFKTRPEVFVDTVKNCADFLIPLNIMGVIEINNGIVGILGLISSLAGATSVWEPTLKLKP